jgi:hypothetical protein
MKKYILLLVICCSCSMNMQSYKIMDRERYVHDYNEPIYKLNKTIHLYCKSHRQWEKVRMLSTSQGTIFIVGKVK